MKPDHHHHTSSPEPVLTGNHNFNRQCYEYKDYSIGASMMPDHHHITTDQSDHVQGVIPDSISKSVAGVCIAVALLVILVVLVSATAICRRKEAKKKRRVLAITRWKAITQK